MPEPPLPQAARPSWLQRLAPGRVLVFRALQLGDMLCAVPALRALRRALPDAEITLVALPWAADLSQRLRDDVDSFVPFPGFPGLPERAPDIRAWPGFLAGLHARRFDLALQLHGDGSRSNAIVELFGAQAMAGFGSGRDGRFMPWPERGAEPARLLALLDFLGADTSDRDLAYPLQPADDEAWAPYPGLRGLQHGSYFCVHAGARAAERRWPPQRFAAVADAIARETGLRPVLSGSAEEKPLTRAVAEAMRTPAIDAAEAVPVGALAALIARSRLLVSNDTGASHLAAALKVPSVIVFRASDMTRWAPEDRERHRAVWDPEGMREGEVLAQARELLGLLQE